MTTVRVHVPASTANLGPGFDCLGLALDLWNQAEFSLEGQGIRVHVSGEGQDMLPINEQNPVAKTACMVYEKLGLELPPGISIYSENHIPVGSGLGSSASAALLGLIGANSLLGNPLSKEELLSLGTEIEGHPDNIAPALFGGLVISTVNNGEVLARKVEILPLSVVVAVPEVNLPTLAARQALPGMVAFRDAILNVGNTALLVEALRFGDWDLLGKVMQDRLHQPYRLKLIPGAEQALQAGLLAGARATALSGAGPSVIAFTPDPSKMDSSIPDQRADIRDAMLEAFAAVGLRGRGFILSVAQGGASISG